MRRRCWVRIFLLAAVVAQLIVPARSPAQELRAAGKRKIVAQVRPVYPPLARKMNITGTVRLLVTVAPVGTMVRTEELGGSPVLVQAALNAVAKAKWEPAAQETKELVEIKFQPGADVD
jgi:TonB family protein